MWRPVGPLPLQQALRCVGWGPGTCAASQAPMIPGALSTAQPPTDREPVPATPELQSPRLSSPGGCLGSPNSATATPWPLLLLGTPTMRWAQGPQPFGDSIWLELHF